jgi:hypothetical protein
MNIFSRIRPDGMSIGLKKEFSIKYPGKVWPSLKDSTKEALADNLTYLKLASYSAILNDRFTFNTRKPILKPLIDRCAKEDFVRFGFEDKINPENLKKRFERATFTFKEGGSPPVDEGSDYDEGAVLSISFGKDSLLSYSILKELDTKARLVFFEDTWDAELMHKKRIIKAFEKEFKEKVDVVVDEVDNLDSDPGLKAVKSNAVFGSNAMNGYMLMCLPFNFQSRYNQLIFGNEQGFNDKFKDTHGNEGYLSYEQSSEGMAVQNKMLTKLTRGNVRLQSFCEPLRDLAEMKVLFRRYPQVAKYQMTCDQPEVEDKDNKWCQVCPACALIYAYLWGVGVDPKAAGFTKNLFEREQEKRHLIFDDKKEIIYNGTARDEILYSFLQAYRNGAKGYLIDKFRKERYPEAKEREEEIYKKAFRIYPSRSLPPRLYSEIKSIYKEELEKD